MTVHNISNMSDKVKQAIADGAWQLLQHFVCRDYKIPNVKKGLVESTADIMLTFYIQKI